LFKIVHIERPGTRTFTRRKDMKILVIDDSPINQAAAKAQLATHDLTVVGSYDEAQALVAKQHEFEVVLCDLLMPASSRAMGGEGEKYIGQEMPLGIFLALLAAKNGARHVAVFTDGCHHDHPAIACFDAFNRRENQPTAFTVGDAKLLLSNCYNWIRSFYRDDLSRIMDYDEYRKDRKKAEQITVEAKNWSKLLDYLLNGPSSSDE